MRTGKQYIIRSVRFISTLTPFVQWGSASMNFLLIHQLTNVTNVVLLFSDLHVLLLEDLLILLQKQDDKLVLKCLSTTFSAGYQDVKVSSSKYPSNQY